MSEQKSDPAMPNYGPVKEAMEALKEFSRSESLMEGLRARKKQREDFQKQVDAARAKARMEWLERGEPLGRIHFCQRLLGQPQTAAEALLTLPIDELRAMADEWERSLTTKV